MSSDGARRGESTLALAYLLILAGAALLVTRLGWIDWRFIGNVVRFWPVALVAVGVDMLSAGKHRKLVYGAALAVAVLLGIVWGALAASHGAAPEAHVGVGLAVRYALLVS